MVRRSDDSKTPAPSVEMTTRGAKHWKLGALPLIAPDVMGDIISDLADVAMLISDAGIIQSVTVSPGVEDVTGLGRMDGKNLRITLTRESVEKLEDSLAAFREVGERSRPLELNHSDGSGNHEFPVRYSLYKVGHSSDILMLGRDLRPVAEMNQQLVAAQIALERDYEVQRDFDTRFRVLMESAGDALVFVSLWSGRISDANAAAASLFGRSRDQLVGRAFADGLVADDQMDVMAELAALAMADGAAPLTLRLKGSGDDVRLVPTLFRTSGERIMLCRIERAPGEGKMADDLTEQLIGLYRASPDSIVFTSEAGAILSANDGFLDLIDAAHDVRVRGRNLSDYLQRGSVDFKVMIDNAARSGKMRLYATKLASEFGAPRAVEIAVTSVTGGGDRVYAFLIRESSRGEAQRSPALPVGDDNLRSVMDLVGASPLKEIVSETTDVVERICIETAVELTSNNRVAAAEMLGLSRQSLYVKLRKYGLLARDTDD